MTFPNHIRELRIPLVTEWFPLIAKLPSLKKLGVSECEENGDWVKEMS